MTFKTTAILIAIAALTCAVVLTEVGRSLVINRMDGLHALVN